jgi:DNA-binding protein HU-beta
MNTNELRDKLHEKFPEMSKKQISEVTHEMVEIIRETVLGGEKVAIANLGTFKQSIRQARNGRNPKTGEALQIPEKTGIKFSVAKKLKTDLNS